MTSGPSRRGFDIDLREGEVHEGELARILALVGPRIEVKTDHKAAHTGNVFVEYAQPTGRSGIAATTAEWWAFNIVGQCIVIVATERLRALARRAWHENRKTRGGDYNRYHGVLVPVEWLTRPFKVAA